jgi:hypothetical protein
MGFGTPHPPQVPLPPPAAHPPIMGANEALTTQENKEAAAASEGMGFGNTIKTSPQGLKTEATAAKATLLG